jgi:hypothetical protein
MGRQIKSNNHWPQLIEGNDKYLIVFLIQTKVFVFSQQEIRSIFAEFELTFSNKQTD